MDALDIKILKTLSVNGRMTLSELSENTGLSSPTLSERIRKLEKKRVIRGFAVLVDPEKTGFPLLSFLAVTLEKPSHRKSFLKLVADMQEVLECHHIAGDFDYLLKVRCRDTAHLEDVISNRIKSLEGVSRTRTMIALSSVKESVIQPMESLEED
ncbi:MAG: Lrp/AsnC family transcriptional regulator [Synergistales bacterium]|nr:Lrp/AsnC family transcriptional regulator [Synergistales bacterium]